MRGTVGVEDGNTTELSSVSVSVVVLGNFPALFVSHGDDPPEFDFCLYFHPKAFSRD
jgi:hypothetical protein